MFVCRQLQLHIDMCTDMCIDMCIDMGTDMRIVYRHVQACVNVCLCVGDYSFTPEFGMVPCGLEHLQPPPETKVAVMMKIIIGKIIRTCMYASMPVCMSGRMSAHMYAQNIHSSLDTLDNLDMCACVHVYTHVYTHLYTHVYTHAYTHVYAHAYTHAYTHA